jgi:hypothetical protein
VGINKFTLIIEDNHYSNPFLFVVFGHKNQIGLQIEEEESKRNGTTNKNQQIKKKKLASSRQKAPENSLEPRTKQKTP